MNELYTGLGEKTRKEMDLWVRCNWTQTTRLKKKKTRPLPCKTCVAKHPKWLHGLVLNHIHTSPTALKKSQHVQELIADSSQLLQVSVVLKSWDLSSHFEAKWDFWSQKIWIWYTLRLLTLFHSRRHYELIMKSCFCTDKIIRPIINQTSNNRLDKQTEHNSKIILMCHLSDFISS